MKPPTSDELPTTFTTKKAQIISAISTPADTYTDNSPKGSIDTPILELINQINAIDGLVTTSSCSGRLAVFVEGPKPTPNRVDTDTEIETTSSTEPPAFGPDTTPKATTGGPAGKGGGAWLYVSHDPVPIPASAPPTFFTGLCGLDTTEPSPRVESYRLATRGRLIKLSFSPLILHVLCATLHHAKGLLAAAINAGFRESGVQSLKALEEPGVGAMVGIRTMGLGFESVVGVVDDGGGREVYRSLVGEGYLAAMVGVINERFEWNVARRERLRVEIARHCVDRLGAVGWEDKDVRRARMREEGLKRRREKAMLLDPRDAEGSDLATERGVTVDTDTVQDESLVTGVVDMFTD